MQWAISQGIDANFYDNCNAATQLGISTILTFPTKGLPPKADGNDDILIVTFIDENGPEGQFDTTAYHCNSVQLSLTHHNIQRVRVIGITLMYGNQHLRINKIILGILLFGKVLPQQLPVM